MRDGARRKVEWFARGPVPLLMAVIATVCGGAAVRAEPRPAAAESETTAKSAAAKQPLRGRRGSDARSRRDWLSGSCVDEAGRPLEGTTVVLCRHHATFPAPTERLREMRTDARGEYEFADLEPPARDPDGDLWMYSVLATADGRAVRFQVVDSSLGKRLSDFVMPPAATLSGRVTDSNGRPIEGADVWASRLGRRPMEGILSARTDRDGKFAITSLAPIDPPGDAGRRGAESDAAEFLMFRHSDYCVLHQSYRRVPNTIEVLLQPAGSITGRVIDDVTGKPAAGVLVAIEETRETSRRWDSRRWDQTLTDERGAYRFTSVSPAKYNVWVRAEERTCIALESVPVEAGKTIEADVLHLIEGAMIEGRVLTIDNRPVTHGSEPFPRLLIGVHGPARPKNGYESDTCRVDKDGKFRLRVAPGRIYPRIVNAEIWGRTWRRDKYEDGVDVQPGQTLTLNFRILEKESPPSPERDRSGP